MPDAADIVLSAVAATVAATVATTVGAEVGAKVTDTRTAAFWVMFSLVGAVKVNPALFESSTAFIAAAIFLGAKTLIPSSMGAVPVNVLSMVTVNVTVGARRAVNTEVTSTPV